MSIQWYPGHMTAARRKAAEAMASVDVVIEVVDARLPEASSNPMLRALCQERQRPCVKVLNKADLADPQVTREWLEHYDRKVGIPAVAVSCKRNAEIARLPDLCAPLAPHRHDVSKPLRLMIVGIPNVGKSTLMNALLRRRLARVGDEPALTRVQQTVQLDLRHWLTDTPGLLWPKIEYASDGLMLAASNAIGRNAIIESEVALFLNELLLARYPFVLKHRYGILLPDPPMEATSVLASIAARRGGRRRGGEVDLERAAVILLQDFRDGLLGRLSLESPATRQRMLASAEASQLSTSPCSPVAPPC